MTHIEIDDLTAEYLKAEAAARSMSVADYLKLLILPTSKPNSEASQEELDAELEQLALDLPTLPEDFSRADIYDEHD